jgi:hypothetical protein
MIEKLIIDKEDGVDTVSLWNKINEIIEAINKINKEKEPK